MAPPPLDVDRTLCLKQIVVGIDLDYGLPA